MTRLLFLLILSVCFSCKKVLKDVHDYFPKVKLVSATELPDGTVELVAEIESEGGSPLTYIGFCMKKDSIPEMLDNQIIVDTLFGNRFKAIYDGFDPYDRYYFRPWASNDHGWVYGDAAYLDSIEAEPVIPPCSQPMNTIDIGDIYGNQSVYSVSAPEQNFTHWDIDLDFDHGTVDLRFGSKPRTGIFQIFPSTSPGPGTVSVGFYSGFTSAALSSGYVYVNQITATSWEMTICDAPWSSGSLNAECSAAFECPL